MSAHHNTVGSSNAAAALACFVVLGKEHRSHPSDACLQDHGCAGGLMDFAFSFIIRNGGLDTEKDYKYKAADGVCNINKEKKHIVTIDSYEDVPAK